jgi:hypothetical protein
MGLARPRRALSVLCATSFLAVVDTTIVSIALPSIRHVMGHLDTVVATREDLQIQRDRALALGATELLDRTDDQDEPLHVFADPAGHPFCIFVG